MKLLLHILLAFSISIVALPQEAQAACGGGEETEHACHQESNGDHDMPCGDSSCDCICCAHVSLILLKKEIPSIEPLYHNHSEVFFYNNFINLLFNSSIWQPPKLG